MLLSIEGEEATAKTTLAYTAPKPIVGFNFDLGAERAIYGTQFDRHFKDLKIEIVKLNTNGNGGIPSSVKLSKKKNDILIYELPQPIQLTQENISGCMELWAYFIQLFSEAAMSDDVQTVVIDTATIARRVKADAYLQELQEGKARKQLLQIEWGHPNDAIRNIYSLMAGLGKNLIITHHLTDHYVPVTNSRGEVDTAPDGTRVLEGLAHTYRFADVAIRQIKKKAEIESLYVKCGYNLSLEDTTVDSDWNSIVSKIEMSLADRIKLPHA